MKTIKKICAAAAGALIAAVFAGCMHVGVDVELRSNGTATAGVTYGMLSDYCTEEDMEDGEHEIIHFDVNGKDYIGFKEQNEYKSFNELNNDMISLSEDGSSLFTNFKAEKKTGLINNTYIFEATMPALTEDSSENAMFGEMLSLDFSVRMPGSVKECSGGTIIKENKGNLIVFVPDTDKECTFSAKSTELNVGGILIVIIVAAVAVGAAVIMANKKKSSM